MTATLIAIVLLLWLIAATYTIGTGAVLGPIRVRSWSEAGERAVFAITLGMGILAYIVLALGLVGFTRTPVFAGIVGLGAIAALARAVLSARGRKSGATGARAATEPSGADRYLPLFAAVALGLLGLLTFIAAVAPPGALEWDSLSYHLADPKTYLQDGRISYLPWDHHSNFPFTLEMLYLLMLGLGSVGAAKLCHWLCGVLLIASVYTFAKRHITPAETGRRVGIVATLIVATTPIVLWEASVAYVDLATALFIWLSLYALMNAAQAVRPEGEAPQTGDSVPWLVVSALMMGFALGTKMTVLAFWGMLLLGILGWHYLTTRRWAKETLPHAALWGGIALLIGAPWYIKTLIYTGNPVYPFFYNLFGGKYWNAQNAADYAANQGMFGFAKTPVNLLLGPWQVTTETLAATAAHRQYVYTEYQPFILSPTLLALVFATPFLLGSRRLSAASRYLGLFAAGVFVFWFFLMQQTRYLIPAVPALAVIGAEGVVVAWEQRRRLIGSFGASLLVLSLLWAAYIEGSMMTVRALPMVLGAQTMDEYVIHEQGGLGAALLWINRNTPPDGKVALFDEVRGYYLDRPYVWATPNHAYGLLPWNTYKDVDDWLADFKKRGYTTLLVNEQNTPATDDGQRWRSLLNAAVLSDKVTLAYAAPAGHRVVNGETIPAEVKVYRIP